MHGAPVPGSAGARRRLTQTRSRCLATAQGCARVAARLPVGDSFAIGSPLVALERHLKPGPQSGPEVVVRALAGNTSRRRCGWAMTVAAALCLHVGAASAARLTAVRVGTHPGYTRVVFETDAPADYELLEAVGEAPGEVTVRIAAESRARDVVPRGPGAPSVTLLPQPDGTTLAQIRASGPLRVETQVLATPPRLVLDLRRAEGESAAAATAVAPEPDSQPPPPEAIEASEPPPQPIAEGAVVEEPSPLPESMADPIPAPAPAPSEAAAAADAPSAIEPPPSLEAIPAVSAPPPTDALQQPSQSDPGIDLRSLALGLAAGFGIALIAFAARRQRAPAAAAAETEASIATPESVGLAPVEAAAADPVVEAVAESSADSAPLLEVGDDWMLDVLRMHQRLDARLAAIADQLGELSRRQSRLEARGGAQNEELASQRTAIARLQRSVRPASNSQPPRQVG